MVETQAESGSGGTESKLSAAGWGLFFVWIGLVFLGGLSTWLALVGIGVITLGMQLVRKALGLAFEGFWLVIGVLFLLGGVWDLTGTDLPLFPILLIVAGAAVLLSVFRGRSS